jgi:hypothetical protein
VPLCVREPDNDLCIGASPNHPSKPADDPTPTAEESTPDKPAAPNNDDDDEGGLGNPGAGGDGNATN